MGTFLWAENFGLTNLTYTDFTATAISDYLRKTLNISRVTWGNTPLDGSFVSSSQTITWDIIENFSVQMIITRQNDNLFWREYKIIIQNNVIYDATDFSTEPSWRLSCCFVYDDATEKAYILFVERQGGENTNSAYIRGETNSNSAATTLYPYVKAAINQPLYEWSSVPAISGKNGILSLTQILNINDGEPVEDITNRGNLDFSKKTKVNTLVSSVYEPTYKEDATKATIEYEIPEAEYQYTKLVYKKKKIPKSASDGTAIDIGADDTEVVVSGLEENSTYYFVVFTNRTKSNAYKFKTGKNDAPEGIFKIRITTAQGIKDNNFKEVIEVTRV